MPGAPAISTTCGRLYGLPLFFCDKLATMPLSILCQHHDRSALSLVRESNQANRNLDNRELQIGDRNPCLVCCPSQFCSTYFLIPASSSLANAFSSHRPFLSMTIRNGFAG